MESIKGLIKSKFIHQVMIKSLKKLQGLPIFIKKWSLIRSRMDLALTSISILIIKIMLKK